MRRIRTATILGKRWRFRWERIDPEDKAVGMCFQSEHEIHIDTRQHGRDLLDTLVHETLHGADKDLSEEKVARYAGAVAGVLWKV